MWKGTEKEKQKKRGNKQTKIPTLLYYAILILDSFFSFIKHITQCADSLQFIKKT